MVPDPHATRGRPCPGCGEPLDASVTHFYGGRYTCQPESDAAKRLLAYALLGKMFQEGPGR